MRLTKRNKLCLAAFLAALGILILDRAVLRPGVSPAQATAALEAAETARQTPTDPTPSPAPAAAEAPDQAPVKQTVTERLEALAQQYEPYQAVPRDAFSISDAWIKQYNPDGLPNENLTPAEKFSRERELKAVVVSGQAGSAVVGNACLFVGEELAGFKLVSVNERSATFECNGQRAVLTLK